MFSLRALQLYQKKKTTSVQRRFLKFFFFLLYSNIKKSVMDGSGHWGRWDSTIILRLKAMIDPKLKTQIINFRLV